MAGRLRLILGAFVLAIGSTVVGCNKSDSDAVRVTTPTVGPGGEATYGAIDHLPGGTAVITSPHTLVALTCNGGTVTMTTTVATFTGTMDCAAMPPANIVDRYLGKPIAITVEGGRLKIENPEAGSLDLPVTEVTS